MCRGAGYGENTAALVQTRGLAELIALGVASGAQEHTFAGLAGVGDLIATCGSPLSRNYTFGSNLGKGMSPEEATKRATESRKVCLRPRRWRARRQTRCIDTACQRYEQGVERRSDMWADARRDFRVGCFRGVDEPSPLCIVLKLWMRTPRRNRSRCR
jgi:hypothetical protein